MSMSKGLLQKLESLPLGMENDRYVPAHKFSKKMTKQRQIKSLLQENKFRLFQRAIVKQNMNKIKKEIRMTQMAPLPKVAETLVSSKQIIEKLQAKRTYNSIKLLPEDHNIERKTFFGTINEQIRHLREIGVGWSNIESNLHTQHLVSIKNNKSAYKAKKEILLKEIELAKKQELENSKALVPQEVEPVDPYMLFVHGKLGL